MKLSQQLLILWPSDVVSWIYLVLQTNEQQVLKEMIVYMYVENRIKKSIVSKNLHTLCN